MDSSVVAVMHGVGGPAVAGLFEPGLAGCADGPTSAFV